MLYRKYKEGKNEVIFKENGDAYLYAMKDGESIEGAVRITVKVEGKTVATYHHVFKILTTLQYNHFVKKFLEEPQFRSDYLTDGNWEGVISYTSESGLNKNCERAIQRLLNKKKPQFKDFASLKTFGRDKFSSAKLEKLKEYVSEEDIQQIHSMLEDEKVVLSAIRWAARGLSAEYAIRKVKTDLEIRKNMA